jgi:cell division protein FtsZ
MENTKNPTTPAFLQLPKLKVVGLGGGGSNAVNRMMELGLRGVDFIAANTDYQALQQSHAPVKVQLGPDLTRGLGAGGDPQKGYKAALESREDLRAALEGADMVFLAAGMGGGTGTGAIAVASEVAREIGAVAIAIVTTPFSFEMGRRQKNANQGLANLQPHTDTLIAIPNDRLLLINPNLPMEVSFRLADDVLRQAVQGIAELITEPGLINVDFAHIRQMMRRGGGALMAIGQAEGEDKARRAVIQALNHPLMESVSLDNASGVIANFSGNDDLSLYELSNALSYIQATAGEEVDVVLGVTNDNRLQDRTQVILVITGLGAPSLEDVLPGAEQSIKAEPSQSQTATENQLVEKPKPRPFQPTPEPGLSTSVMNDLDLPAFMRRRNRYTETETAVQPMYMEQDQ